LEFGCQFPGQRGKSFDRDVLARAGGLDAGRRQQRERVGAQRFQALAQHFAALAEGASVTCAPARGATGQRFGPRTSWITDEVTLGGGTKADGLYVEQDFRLRAPRRQHRQPAVLLAAGRGASRRRPRAETFSTSRSYHGGHGSRTASRSGARRDVVGQVGDDPHRAAVKQRLGSNCMASPGTTVRRPRIVRAISATPPAAPLVAPTAMTRRATFSGSARSAHLGPGPISTTVDAVERACARAMRPVDEVEQEVLAERLPAPKGRGPGSRRGSGGRPSERSLNRLCPGHRAA